jgi:ribosomal protein S8
MPMTFAEAYHVICPYGGEVLPNSRLYYDILEVMRQSGYVPLNDRLVKDKEEKKPTTVQQAMPFIERKVATEPSGKISKRQWLSIDAHREAFNKHLNKK